MKRYWVLKTREDIDRAKNIFREHWTEFKDEHVIAIGWDITTKPPEMTTQADIENELRITFYTDRTVKAARQAKIAARTVWKFISEMSIGDEVLLCRGYTKNQKKGVRIYGFARVEGQCQRDQYSDWWKLKRCADIWPVDRDVSRERLAEILQKGTLLSTLHEVKKGSDFEQLKQWLRIHR